MGQRPASDSRRRSLEQGPSSPRAEAVRDQAAAHAAGSSANGAALYTFGRCRPPPGPDALRCGTPNASVFGRPRRLSTRRRRKSVSAGVLTSGYSGQPVGPLHIARGAFPHRLWTPSAHTCGGCLKVSQSDLAELVGAANKAVRVSVGVREANAVARVLGSRVERLTRVRPSRCRARGSGRD